MQCHDPAAIYYALHKDEYWLPLIRDPIYPHPRMEEDMKKFNKWLKKKKDVNKSGQPTITNTSKLDYKIRGDFMKPFQSFYGPKSFLPALTDVECEKF